MSLPCTMYEVLKRHCYLMMHYVSHGHFLTIRSLLFLSIYVRLIQDYEPPGSEEEQCNLMVLVVLAW